ncbi:MAG: elongation factor 1-beta [Thermoprotei archaeon]|nr:MAG: elongation factor 1-beta [Thermoprotei archaeon]RLF00357.1 MAG: elongation factor 1-beta [Thermoprotei archaeon]
MGGRVYVVIKVYPEDIDVNLNSLLGEIRKSLPKGVSLVKSEEEPIAFGLKILKVHLIMPEETEGGTSKIEEIIAQIKGVSQVEVAWLTRMSS